MQSGLEKEYHSLSQLGEIQRLYNSSNLSIREALFVTTQLVNHGYPEAQGAIDVLRSKLPQEAAQEYLNQLQKRHAAVQAVPNLLQILGDEKAVRALYETSGFVFRPGSTRSSVAVVIFTSKFNNYHLANPILDSLLSNLGVARLFLKDTTSSVYFNGVNGLSQSLQALPGAIQELLTQEGCKQAIVTGFSSGGYAALYTALHMENIGYAGFATHTDISASSRLPALRLYNAARKETSAECFLDICARLGESGDKPKIKLYYGGKDALDRAHALHLSGLENVNVFEVANAGHHVTSALMERGELQLPFVEFLEAADY
jgi:hypothetical protein